MDVKECIRLLKGCSNLSQAKELHAFISSKSRLSNHSYLSFLFMETYVNCGSVEDARRVFDEINVKTSFALSTMLKAYSSNLIEAKALFDEMPQFHDQLSYTTMVSLYGSHGKVEEAKSMFDQIRHPDVPSGNAMISCFSRNGHPWEALDCFEKMAERNVVSWTALVTAYAQNRHLLEAHYVFNAMPQRNAFSWNTMVSSYGESGQLGHAKDLFDRMPERTLVSLNSMLAAYAYSYSAMEAKAFFEKMPKWNVVSWNTAMTAFAECDDTQQVKVLFDKMPHRTDITWNLMLKCYIANEQHLKEAQELFNQIPYKNDFSWGTLLHGYACHGQFGMANALLKVMPQWNVISWNGLLGGYAQRGHVEEAKDLFEKMPVRDLISWTALLSGYAQAGHAKSAFLTLMLMQLEGVQPNQVPFLCILLVCNHVGSLKLGRSCFLSMRGDHYIEPGKDHYTCMVDLLARSGHLDDAEDLLYNMPFLPCGVAWDALLGACRNEKDLHRAQRAAKGALEFGHVQDTSGSYMLLAGSYS